MRRVLDLARWALPLSMAIAGGALTFGGGVVDQALAAICGAVLGMLLHLLVCSVALLAGHIDPPVPGADRRRRLLQNDKQMLLRSIREIEFDAQVQKLSTEEAARLTEPLRRRAIRVLRELDEFQVEDDLDVDQQIEREVARRLGVTSRGAG